MLSREEREIESMVAQIEQKQKRLNELEGLMSGLYEKQQMLLNAPDDYTTPPMSTTNATINSDSSTANDRIERIERLLIHGMFFSNFVSHEVWCLTRAAVRIPFEILRRKKNTQFYRTSWWKSEIYVRPG